MSNDHPVDTNINNPSDLAKKWQVLLEIISQMGEVAVAFSGGVDSSLLCLAAFYALGEKMTAYTIHSPVDNPSDLENATSLAKQIGFPHVVIDYDDLEMEDFKSNTPDRCYFCKLERFKNLSRLTGKQILEGSNVDDQGDYRPGMRAVKELGIRSPLIESGLGKEEIRRLARIFELPVWDRPSSPCLATRFPYGIQISREGLKMIALAEAFLHSLGFTSVRVRYYGDLAKIEISDSQMSLVISQKENIINYFRGIGFKFISLDLEGFQSGRLNRMLK